MKKNGKATPILISVCLSFFLLGYAQRMVRHSAVSGKFYPSDRVTLSRDVNNHLDGVSLKNIPGDIQGIMVPHAGYIFSGEIAAHAYKAVGENRPKVVYLIGPAHHAPGPYVSVFPSGVYETPLGEVRVNEEIARGLLNEDRRLIFNREAHLYEHSLEVQLPFLQTLWGDDFTIVPVLMGASDWQFVQLVKEAVLNNLPAEPFLLVASSDLSHYHDYQDALRIDRHTLRFIKNYESASLREHLSLGKGELCGGGAVLAVMEICRELGADQARVLKYANSGDTAPPWLRNKESVVGYGSVIFYKEGGPDGRKEKEEEVLNREDRQKLIGIARQAIKSVLRKERIPDWGEVSQALKEPRGAFVTINKGDSLRGCVGYIEPILPLYQAVGELAVSAAFRDKRFSPLTLAEFEEISVEISVLSPSRKLESIEDIQIGKHGLIIKKDFYSGVLLPQVAAEYGWDRMEYLERLCQKAGLPPGGWKDAQLFAFTAEIFHEGEE